ncbi:MAG: dTMP kinase [Rhizobiales bacterium]|nr:dTMP kinase [Hyphomicrobiales bacterium]
MPGTFITFEGGEGAGKSTQIRLLAEKLEAAGNDVVITREPGGSPGAEILRHLLLSGAAEALGPSTEVAIFAAARLDHMQETILPALNDGKIVLCDRFIDSTRAYQGGPQGASDAEIRALEAISIAGRAPDLTLILDIAPEIGMARVQSRLERKGGGEVADRFEKDTLAIHAARRERFLTIARQEARRCIVIDAAQDSDSVADVIWSMVRSRLLERSAEPRRR